MVVLSSLRATLWSFGRRPPPASAAAAVLVLGAGIVKRQLSALSERITESASGELEGPAELGWRIRNRCDQLFSKHSSPPQGFGLAGGVPFIHSTHSSPPQGFQPRWRGTFLCGCQKLRCGVSWAPRKADAAERREADAAELRCRGDRWGWRCWFASVPLLEPTPCRPVLRPGPAIDRHESRRRRWQGRFAGRKFRVPSVFGGSRRKVGAMSTV